MDLPPVTSGEPPQRVAVNPQDLLQRDEESVKLVQEIEAAPILLFFAIAIPYFLGPKVLYILEPTLAGIAGLAPLHDQQLPVPSGLS